METASLLVKLSGSVGRRDILYRESGTITQLCLGVEGTPRLVSLYFIVKEKKGGETPEAQHRQIRVRWKKDTSWSSCSDITGKEENHIVASWGAGKRTQKTRPFSMSSWIRLFTL